MVDRDHDKAVAGQLFYEKCVLSSLATPCRIEKQQWKWRVSSRNRRILQRMRLHHSHIGRQKRGLIPVDGKAHEFQPWPPSIPDLYH